MSDTDLRILLLEDSTTDAELVQYHLRKHFRPAVFQLAMTETDFGNQLERFRPHVVLADNSLPQFDAATALKMVRERYSSISFIMVTGTVSEEFAAGIILQGADDYILKDRLTRLPAAIDAALHKHRQEEEKKKALALLIRSEEQYRSLVERISDGFMSLDTQWQVTYINTKAEQLLNRQKDILLGKNIWDEFTEGEEHVFYQDFHTAMREQRYISNTDYYAPLDLWRENHIYPSADGLSVFIRDVSEKKRLELELREQERKAQLEKIAASLTAQEKERSLIGAELHDNVNQILSAAYLLLSVAKKAPHRSSELIPRCMDYIKKAVEENRKLAHGLVAPNLKNETLVSQATLLSVSMFQSSGIAATLQHDQFDESLLSSDQKLAVYRILQEQCSNIIKHSAARNVWLNFNSNGSTFAMQVRDDGKGVEASGKQSKGIGLKNISSRLEVLGGTMFTRSAPGQGFLLEVILPVHGLK